MGIMGVEPWMTQRRPKKRAKTNYAAADAGSFGVTPKATADWQTIDAASLAPNPQNGGGGDFSNLEATREVVSPTSPFKELGGDTGGPTGNQFEAYTGGDTSIDTFGTSAQDDLYYNLVNALSGNQYNRELIGQDLAFGLDTANRNRDRGFRGLENTLNSRGMWDSGVMNRDVGEFESDQLRAIGEMLRAADLQTQNLGLNDFGQEQNYYSGVDSDALADALRVAGESADIEDPNALRAKIAQQIRNTRSS
jgi:hypothetical protein